MQGILAEMYDELCKHAANLNMKPVLSAYRRILGTQSKDNPRIFLEAVMPALFASGKSWSEIHNAIQSLHSIAPYIDLNLLYGYWLVDPMNSTALFFRTEDEYLDLLHGLEAARETYEVEQKQLPPRIAYVKGMSELPSVQKAVIEANFGNLDRVPNEYIQDAADQYVGPSKEDYMYLLEHSQTRSDIMDALRYDYGAYHLI